MPSYHSAVMNPVKHYKNSVEDTRKYMLTMELEQNAPFTFSMPYHHSFYLLKDRL